MNRHGVTTMDTASNESVEIQPGYMSLKAAAKYAANVSERTVVRWLHEGLPSIQPKKHGRRLIRVADLDAFLLGKRSVHGKDLHQLVHETAEELGVRRP